MLKIRRSHDRLIFNMGIHIPGKGGLYIESGPSLFDTDSNMAAEDLVPCATRASAGMESSMFTLKFADPTRER